MDHKLMEDNKKVDAALAKEKIHEAEVRENLEKERAEKEGKCGCHCHCKNKDK